MANDRYLITLQVRLTNTKTGVSLTPVPITTNMEFGVGDDCASGKVGGGGGDEGWGVKSVSNYILYAVCYVSLHSVHIVKQVV